MLLQALREEAMKPKDLVVTDLHGKIVEGNSKASSDLRTHLVLYKAFPEIGGVTHTHSEYATAWAEGHRPISCLGTTHADYFHGPVPVTADMTDREIASAYEKNTGDAIVRTFERADWRGSCRPGIEPRSLHVGARMQRSPHIMQ
jgi:L-ribulose-5-phosphate 4-epimerase